MNNLINRRQLCGIGLASLFTPLLNNCVINGETVRQNLRGEKIHCIDFTWCGDYQDCVVSLSNGKKVKYLMGIGDIKEEQIDNIKHKNDNLTDMYLMNNTVALYNKDGCYIWKMKNRVLES